MPEEDKTGTWVRPTASVADPVHEELSLKDRALEEAFEGIIISDARLPDNPLIYVNSGFERLTGYSRAEVLGRNCRFLQGPEVDQPELDRLRAALKKREPCTVLLENFRKDGSPFWNRLSITPVRDPAGVVTHFIGVQSDVSEEKETRDALKAANLGLQSANGRLKRDLDAAAKVQRSFLPSKLPTLPGVRFATVFRPCTELAGDMFNAVVRHDGSVALYILDVSGHGVASALLSVTVSHQLSAAAAPGQILADVTTFQSPARMLDRLNRQFGTSQETAQYFTIVCAILEPRSSRLTYASAGHWEPVLVTRDGTARRLSSNGMPIGLFEESSYSEETLQLNVGDRIFLYTDGILDAESPAGEHFGVERLLLELTSIGGLPLEAGLDALMENLSCWAGSVDFEDDISMLAFEIEG